MYLPDEIMLRILSKFDLKDYETVSNLMRVCKRLRDIILASDYAMTILIFEYWEQERAIDVEKTTAIGDWVCEKEIDGKIMDLRIGKKSLINLIFIFSRAVDEDSQLSVTIRTPSYIFGTTKFSIVDTDTFVLRRQDWYLFINPMDCEDKILGVSVFMSKHKDLV